MTKQTVAVLFGGQSSEHDVSCVSAANVIDHINREKYDILLIGITKSGKWIYTESVQAIRSGEWENGKTRAVLSPDAEMKSVILMDGNHKTEYRKVDVIFPVLHGLYGEDGTVQGIFELSGIPYVGCGVLASAVSMDKYYTKIIVDTLGIRQADYVAVRKEELKEIEAAADKVEAKLSYPVFIKPCNAGSSQGVSKAENREMLQAGLLAAAEHDRKILVEETINGREIECAVLGGSDVRASGVGEILAASEAVFYDYEAKYHNADSRTVLDPDLPEETVQKIRQDAVAIFKAVDGFGLSRVDFFVSRDTGEVIFNEINTLPGFTAISMYPMLWENKGISKSQLVEKLIQMAFSRKEK